MKRNRCKKIAAALLCMVMGCTTLGQGFSAAAADATTSEEEVEINFAKALQMSLYFYDANSAALALRAEIWNGVGTATQKMQPYR